MANFGDLAVTRETGSCPFLMSWDAERQEWIDHRKVLDKAPQPDLQYSEVKLFPGFQSRFRIEEREPEIALIDEAEQTIVLRNGERRRLRADHAKLATRYQSDATVAFNEQRPFFSVSREPHSSGHTRSVLPRPRLVRHASG